MFKDRAVQSTSLVAAIELVATTDVKKVKKQQELSGNRLTH